MAAHVDITDNSYHGITLTTADVVRGIDGPIGATVCWIHPYTAGAVVFAQSGAPSDFVDGTTDISADAVPLASLDDRGYLCPIQDAPGASGEHGRPTVYIQTDTATTDVRVRFTTTIGEAS